MTCKKCGSLESVAVEDFSKGRSSEFSVGSFQPTAPIPEPCWGLQPSVWETPILRMVLSLCFAFLGLRSLINNILGARPGDSPHFQCTYYVEWCIDAFCSFDSGMEGWCKNELHFIVKFWSWFPLNRKWEKRMFHFKTINRRELYPITDLLNRDASKQLASCSPLFLSFLFKPSN